jgi:Domain of unknown function (DUF5658)
MNALLLVLLGLLQMADGTVTYVGIRGAMVDEANPLAELCFGHLGLGCSITVAKLIGLAIIGSVFLRRHRFNKRRHFTATLSVLVSAYSWVVANNVMLILAA